MSAPDLRPIADGETVAITVATRNRFAYLASLLGCLVNQTYPHWMLVLNDQSDGDAAADDAVADLLDIVRSAGHRVELLRTNDAPQRFQRCMSAVPREIEFVLRVDDDVLLTPTCLEKLLLCFRYFPDRPLAAVGPCLPEPKMQPIRIEALLADPTGVPSVDRPTWRLQGHAYRSREILEVESLWGSAMCYRRSAAEAVGGWAVPGLSEQVHREDSDMSARLLAAGYELMVSTEALGWHLVAPCGGSRTFRKTPGGNVLLSDSRPFAADDAIFAARVAALLAAGMPRRPLRRYAVADLERGRRRPRPRLKLGQRAVWEVRQAAHRVLGALRRRG